jgi:hypothetical protein
VSYSISGSPAGPWQLQVTVGASVTFYTVTADGVIS